MGKKFFSLVYECIWKIDKKTRITAMLSAAVVLMVSSAFWAGYLVGASGGETADARQAIDEVRHLMPDELNGLTVGVMFDSISARRYWWTHIATEERFLLPNRETIWVHFFGETAKGYMHVSINLDRGNQRVVYHLFVAGQPVRLDDLYEMFRGRED